MANKKLGKAKTSKKDEFYTRYEDIQAELNHYEAHFRGKTVLCNCDDPFESNFCKFFLRNFNYLGLKRLICTSYTTSPVVGTQMTLWDLLDEPVQRGNGYVMDISEVPMANGRGVSDDDIHKLLHSKKRGVKKLKGCFTEVIPDRIEAGTYLIIASLIGKDLTISNIIPNHLEALIAKLNECGVEMEQGIDYIRVLEPKEYKATSIKTLVYPGFPTDLQQIMATFLTQCKGRSVIEETIYENRFLNLFELNKMGADTKVLANNQKAIIKGKTKLIGTEVNSTDLRGGASLLVAALIAEGTTTIDNIGYILRGYDKIVEKLSSVGAKIEII